MQIKYWLAPLAGLLLLPLVARGLTLEEAKLQQLVAEAETGYLVAKAAAPPIDVSALVADINRRRLAAYEKAAAEAGVSVKVVAARTAQKLRERAQAGQ